MLVIIVLCVSIVWSKFGQGVLEDNFLARLYTSYDSVVQFLSFYALLNLYVYVMVYVYSPTSGPPVPGFPLRGDNAAMSALVDSDEEVIYGSEEEEARRPLNSVHDDDSD